MPLDNSHQITGIVGKALYWSRSLQCFAQRKKTWIVSTEIG